jgi:phosphoglycerate dehydrogenase-like enzyme
VPSLRVVLYGALVYDLVDLLQSKLSVPVSITRLMGTEEASVCAAACADADVIVAMSNIELPPAPRLRLLQVAGAGLDRIDLARVPSEAFVCNAYGHEIAAGEYVVLAMLAWCHRFVEAHQSFQTGSWRMSGRFRAPLHEELFGKTVAIVGLGPIGLAAARLTKAFGTSIVGLNRTLGDRPTFVDELYPLSDLSRVLPRCDFVAVCVAQTAETTGLIDAGALRWMKPDAVIVNVARGPVVDEQALYEALRERTIGGAVIDAWYQYPHNGDFQTRPSRFPFHELPNVLMTPHSAIWTNGMIERRWTVIAQNVEAIARGSILSLQHVVRPPLAGAAS